jgi:hypothetical protein
MNLKPVLDPDLSEITFNINASDADDDQLSYKWLVNDEDSGVRTSTFIFKRSSYDTGSYNLTVEVTDSEGSTIEQTWTIEVQPTKKETNGGSGALVLLAIVIVIIIILLFVFILKKKKGPVSEIEDIFLISDSGMLLAHKSKELRPDSNEDILSGMLTAIQDFIRDAFKDKTQFGLRRLDFGDSEIHLKRGTGFFLAVVLSGTEPPDFEIKLDKTVKDIEAKYGDVLSDWKGNFSQVRGIKDQLDGLLK